MCITILFERRALADREVRTAGIENRIRLSAHQGR